MSGFGSVVSINPPIKFPTTIAPSATYNTGVFQVPGNNAGIGYLAAGATSWTFQRYLDGGKALPIDAGTTGTGSAATSVIIESNDGKAWGFGVLTVTDTSGAPNAISAFQIVVVQGGH